MFVCELWPVSFRTFPEILYEYNLCQNCRFYMQNILVWQVCLCALHCSHINLFFIYFSFIHYFTRINKYKVIKFLIFVIHIWEIFNFCRCSCYSTLRSSTCVTLLAHFIIVLYINYKWKFVQGNKKGHYNCILVASLQDDDKQRN